MRSLLENVSISSSFAVPEGAYMFMSESVPKVAVIARPDGSLETLVIGMMSHERITVPRFVVRML